MLHCFTYFHLNQCSFSPTFHLSFPFPFPSHFYSILLFISLISISVSCYSLLFQSLGKLTHDVAALTMDVQMSVTSSALLIFITGRLKLGDDGNPLLFSHTFQLVATGPGQYYVHNELFRLLY